MATDHAAIARAFAMPEGYREVCFGAGVVRQPDAFDRACRFDVFTGANYQPTEAGLLLLQCISEQVPAATADKAVLAALGACKESEPIDQRDFVRCLVRALEERLDPGVVSLLERESLARFCPATCGLVALAIYIKEAAKPGLIRIDRGIVEPQPTPGHVRQDANTALLNFA